MITELEKWFNTPCQCEMLREDLINLVKILQKERDDIEKDYNNFKEKATEVWDYI